MSSTTSTVIAPLSTPETIDGEPVLLRATLSRKWECYRACQCFGAFAAGHAPGLLLLGIPYCLFCASARRLEAASFSLVITPFALHYTQKWVLYHFVYSRQYFCVLLFAYRMYAFGCCCQQTTIKTIPLCVSHVLTECACCLVLFCNALCFREKIQDIMLVSDCCG